MLFVLKTVQELLIIDYLNFFIATILWFMRLVCMEYWRPTCLFGHWNRNAHPQQEI